MVKLRQFVPQAEALLLEIAQRPLAQMRLAFIDVSDYELTRALPDNLKSSLPSIEEIEAELSGEAGR